MPTCVASASSTRRRCCRPRSADELAERYGLGLVRESLSACMAAGSIARQPVEPLAHVLLAALLEAATLVADGADRAEVDGVVERLLEGLR